MWKCCFNLKVACPSWCQVPRSNIENTYYCAGTDQAKGRGGRVLTEDICCLYYSMEDLVPFDEVKKCQTGHVKNPLLQLHQSHCQVAWWRNRL